MANLEEIALRPEWSTIETSFTQHPKIKARNSKRKMLPLKPYLPMWNKIFALVCVVAVSLDPLFIYIPIINEDNKCITTDKKLGITAVVLRLFTDLIYIGDIIYIVAKSSQELKRLGIWKIDKFKNALAILKLSWLHILVDILAILPIPQVIMLSSFTKMKDLGSLNKRQFLNLVLLSQYVPRVFRIYLSSKEVAKIQDILTATVWINGAFNFFLYILASHVFGAFWYFFSVQRETACWFQASKGKPGYDANTVCDGKKAPPPEYTTFLENKCLIKYNPEITIDPPFDFGIFLDALQSGLLGSYDFPRKLTYCFWWGLRNLSSVGQNLKTSTYIWETLFAVSISIVGLLLFLYLIGNLQTYLQMATTRSEEVRRKMKLKELEVDWWISKNGLPKEMKSTIMQNVKDSLKENKDVDVQNLLSALPREDRRAIKRLLCSATLRKVEMLRNVKEEVLEVICDHMKPVIYTENSYIIREGDPLDQMILITQGTVWVYTGNSCSHGRRSNGGTNASSSNTTKRLKKGDIYGEELVKWSLTHNSLSDFPISNENVRSHTKVEGFALKANDLMNAISNYWWLFSRNLCGLKTSSSNNSPAKRWENLAISAVKSVRQCRPTRAKIMSLQIEDDEKRSQTLNYRRLTPKGRL
ncbi:cyclic nucleotide-gated ion channel 1 isoform X2 [Ziziphus jujuba]|uniref:Cyclic nucleotide-gated ion channel 1 isoform X2 n=1 Tax=Ziziphus jujuba TaxID=326968 RepID=A0ABM3I339_ZIZJJ|nr:cyclic nucleotide-gated ion channel 1 isoform X2 [Ziziphus jujuba]